MVGDIIAALLHYFEEVSIALSSPGCYSGF